jgi:hypothetical protein
MCNILNIERIQLYAIGTRVSSFLKMLHAVFLMIMNKLQLLWVTTHLVFYICYFFFGGYDPEL